MNVSALIGYPLAALSAAMLLTLCVLHFDNVTIWWPLWPTFGLGVVVGVALLLPVFEKTI